MESKEYSWKYVISSEKLSDGPCELVAAHLVPSGITTTTVLYNGKNASGVPIVALYATTSDLAPFVPPVPVYCSNGLYINFGSAVIGVLVQWRELKGT